MSTSPAMNSLLSSKSPSSICSTRKHFLVSVVSRLNQRRECQNILSIWRTKPLQCGFLLSSCMRPGYVGWLVRQLALANDERELDDHAIVFVDMLERFTYADSPLQKYPDSVDTLGQVSYKKDWVVGRAVVTIETVGEDGHVKITRRKSVRAALYISLMTGKYARNVCAGRD